MGSHGREAGSTGRWSNVRGKGGLHHKSSCWGVVGSLSLEEKEARKAEELFTIILRPEKARQLTEIQTTY